MDEQNQNDETKDYKCENCGSETKGEAGECCGKEREKKCENCGQAKKGNGCGCD